MPLMLFLVASALLFSPAAAQERWRQLAGSAGAYAFDLQSLTVDAGILRAEVRTQDIGNTVLVEQLEVRCTQSQLRTVAKRRYDRDTDRAVASDNPEVPRRDVPWADYTAGSEGHAIIASLCDVARARSRGPT
jgi:hypothetical protein